MSGQFDGRVALITGAGGDIGGAAAELFAEGGGAVVGVDLNAEGLRALQARLPARARFTAITADVSDEAQVTAYVAATMAAHGRIDVFFNNAGIEGSRTGAWRPIADLPLEDFRQILSVNASGVFYGLKHVAPEMRAAGRGAIVNTSSIFGLKGSRNQIAYVASKHAVRAMTASAATALRGDGIRVNAIAPGAIEGRMLRDFMAIIDEYAPPPDADRPARYNPPPIERWSHPREIAQLAIFLASDEAQAITGGCYSVDGGLITL